MFVKENLNMEKSYAVYISNALELLELKCSELFETKELNFVNEVLNMQYCNCSNLSPALMEFKKILEIRKFKFLSTIAVGNLTRKKL